MQYVSSPVSGFRRGRGRELGPVVGGAGSPGARQRVQLLPNGDFFPRPLLPARCRSPSTAVLAAVLRVQPSQHFQLSQRSLQYQKPQFSQQFPPQQHQFPQPQPGPSYSTLMVIVSPIMYFIASWKLYCSSHLYLPQSVLLSVLMVCSVQ